MKITTAIRQIQDAKYCYYGVRTDKRAYNIGDRLPISRRWDDNNVVKGVYESGVCSTGIDDDSNVRSICTTLSIHREQGYQGGYIYIIGGYSHEWGSDRKESIIHDAKIVAVLATPVRRQK